MTVNSITDDVLKVKSHLVDADLLVLQALEPAEADARAMRTLRTLRHRLMRAQADVESLLNTQTLTP